MALGVDIAPEYLPKRTGDILDTLADISEAKRHLDWEPQMSIAQGIRELVRGG